MLHGVAWGVRRVGDDLVIAAGGALARAIRCGSGRAGSWLMCVWMHVFCRECILVRIVVGEICCQRGRGGGAEGVDIIPLVCVLSVARGSTPL